MNKKIAQFISEINLNDIIVFFLSLLILSFSGFVDYSEALGLGIFIWSSWSICLPILIAIVLVSYFTDKNLNKIKKESFKFLRFWFPWILSLFFYRNLVNVTSRLDSKLINDVLIQADLLILGFHPSIYLENFVNPLLTDYLTIVYLFGYILLPPVLGLYLYFKNRKFTYTYVRAILLAMVIGFLCYIYFPAVQPVYYSPDWYSIGLYGNVIPDAREAIGAVDDSVTNAFPSLHTAISTLVLFFAFKFNRKLGLVVLPIVVSLWFATLYLRAHYFIDLVAGWILVLLIILLADKLENLLSKFKLKLITFLQ